jgi:hypothetical protein
LPTVVRDDRDGGGYNPVRGFIHRGVARSLLLRPWRFDNALIERSARANALVLPAA